MITTTYTCDKCKTRKEPLQLYTINLSATPLDHQTDYPMTPACGASHWCLDCMRESNWFRTAETPAQPEPPPPAPLEELIIKLVESVLDNRS